MDTDSLICLDSVEKSAFEKLRLKNVKKSLSDIFKILEESIDSAGLDADEDRNLLNSDQIQNYLKSSNSSRALGDLIEVFSSTIKELKNISDMRKTNKLDLRISDEVLIQPISENSKKYTNPPEKKNEFSNRYPELFEIFSEESKSQFSNLSLKSETKIFDSNIGKSLNYEAPEKLVKNANCTFSNYFHQQPSGSIEEDILSEKLQFPDFENNPEKLENSRPNKLTTSSNSSLSSWKTLKTPRNDENNIPGVSFNSRSIYELEIDSGIGNGKLKLKTGNQKRIKKKRLSLNVEKVQGDIELKKSRVLVVKSDTKINEKSKKKIGSGREKKERILMVLDILLEVKTNLFSNRKLAESIQERFQNCSVLESVVSPRVIDSLDEEISRYGMSVENRKNHEVIFGVEELLWDSVLRLKEAVKEEKDYLKQQEYYYCKKFSELINNKSRTGNLRRTTVHTLIGNGSSLSLTQKEKIEELISYTISLIKKILPKKDLNILSKKTCKRNSIRHVETEEDPQTQIEIFSASKDISGSSKAENKRKIEANFKNENKKNESKPRMDPTFVKQNPEVLKINKKYLSNEKLPRSSTLVIDGSNKDLKQTSNQAIKLTNKGRCHSTIQPIWKPAGNAKTTIPAQLILRQKTRQILSNVDKKKEKLNEELTRNQQSSKNNFAKESSARNSKSHMQKSSTNFKSDLLQKSDTKFLKGQERETEQKSKSETRNSNFIFEKQDPQKENLNSNQEILKTKRKLKQPEAIKMLKQFIKNTSEEEHINSRRDGVFENTSKSLETSECDISVRFLKSKNKLELSHSSFASTSMIKENSKNPSKIEFKVQNSKNLSRSENPLKNPAGSKNDVFARKSKTSRIQLDEDKNKILKTSSARNPKSESKNSLVKNFNEIKGSSRIIDSRSKTIIKDNKRDDIENFSLHSSRSNNSKSGSETFPKNYLKKNSNSYLQSYFKLNSRQNASNNSLINKEMKIEEKMKSQEKVLEASRSKKLIDSNLEPDVEFSPEVIKSSGSLTRINSSKYCREEMKVESVEKLLKSSNVITKLMDHLEPNVQFLPEAIRPSESLTRNFSKYCQEEIKIEDKMRSKENVLESSNVIQKLIDNLEPDIPLLSEAVKCSEAPIRINSSKYCQEEIKIEDEIKSEEKVLKSSNDIKKLIDNLEPDIPLLSEAIKSSESLIRINSSKYCQVSLEPSICSRISGDNYEELNQIVKTDAHFLDEHCQSSKDFIEKKKKSSTKHSRYFLILKDILQNHGLDVNSVDEAARKLRSTKGSKSIYYDKGDGNLLAISSSKTLLDKLATLSDSSFEELEINDLNQYSLESSDQAIRISESEGYFQKSETSLFLNKKVASSDQVIFVQTKKSEESQTILENRIFTDVEISCNLENFSSKKEASTEVSLKNLFEAETQTKFNSEKNTNTDLWMNPEIEDSNFGMNEKEKENLEMNSFLEYENLCKNKKILLVNSSEKENIIDEEMKLGKIEEDSGKEDENICNINQDQADDFFSKEETDGNGGIEVEDIKEESGKDNKNICKINHDQADFLSRLGTDERSEEIELEDIEDVEEESGRDNKNICKVNQDQADNFFPKEEAGDGNEEIELEDTEEGSGKDNKKICKINQDQSDFFSKEETNDGNEEIKLEDIAKESEKDNKNISMINQDPADFFSKEETEEENKEKFQKFEDLEKKVFETEFLSHYELGPDLEEVEDTKKEGIERNKVSVPIYTLSKSKIPSLKSLEFKDTNPQNEIYKFISKFEVTSPFLVFYNTKIPKREKIKNLKQVQFSESYNKISETLKLATRRAKNLYEGAKFFREKMNFEEHQKEEKFYLQRKKDEDIETTFHFNEIISEKKLLGSEKFFPEKKPNFLISNFKSKILKTNVQDFEKHEKSSNNFPEVREVIIYLLENVEKNLEENHETFNFEKRNEKEDRKFRFGDNFSICLALCSTIFFVFLLMYS